MDMYIFQLKRVNDSTVQYLYVDSWNLVLKVLASLEGTDDVVSVTRIKVINSFD